MSDLASSNGTFVNGQLIREPVELVDGDTLSIAGSRQFRVCIDGTARHGASMAEAARTTVDSEWKTRLVWSADELVELEADRQRILAAWKKEQAQAAAAAQQPAGQKATPAAPKAARLPATEGRGARTESCAAGSQDGRAGTEGRTRAQGGSAGSEAAAPKGPTDRPAVVAPQAAEKKSAPRSRPGSAGSAEARCSRCAAGSAGPAQGSHSIRESDWTGRLVQARTGPPRGRAFG